MSCMEALDQAYTCLKITLGNTEQHYPLVKRAQLLALQLNTRCHSWTHYQCGSLALCPLTEPWGVGVWVLPCGEGLVSYTAPCFAVIEYYVRSCYLQMSIVSIFFRIAFVLMGPTIRSGIFTLRCRSIQGICVIYLELLIRVLQFLAFKLVRTNFNALKWPANNRKHFSL